MSDHNDTPPEFPEFPETPDAPKIPGAQHVRDIGGGWTAPITPLTPEALERRLAAERLTGDPRADAPATDALDQIAQNNQTWTHGRALPMNQPLTEDLIQKIRVDFAAFADRHGIFHSQVAKELDLSPSTISQWRSGQYAGDNAKLALAINDWIERTGRKQRGKLRQDFVWTVNAKDIQAHTFSAYETCSMVAIVAPAGTGKTMTLQVLAEQMRGVYLRCNSRMRPRAFTEALGAAIGLRMAGGTTAARLAAIVDKLRGSNRPIFLDEAHLLPGQVMEDIRTIHDEAALAIILAGTDEIVERINDAAGGRGQFASRCQRYNMMERIFNVEDPTGQKSKRGRALFTKDEIRQVFAKAQLRFDAEALDLLWSIACLPNRGGLRIVWKVVQFTLKADSSAAPDRKRLVDSLKHFYGVGGGAMVAVADRHAQAMREVA